MLAVGKHKEPITLRSSCEIKVIKINIISGFINLGSVKPQCLKIVTPGVI